MTRRTFLLSAPAALVSCRRRALSPADTIRIACVGVRSRGSAHIREYAAMRSVEIAAVCDVDESVLDGAVRLVEALGRKRPAAFVDFRDALEDKSIDAVSIATPNHWHALQAIWACQAGKDVYVEAPCSHNPFESRQIVAAARKYKRVVQHGAGHRSSPAVAEAVRKLREGVIGEVRSVRAACHSGGGSIGRAPAGPAPSGVHYDLWLGPASRHPFTANRFHSNWRWFWDYGNGGAGSEGIHCIDLCRWMIGARYPERVSSTGTRIFDDDQETPQVQSAVFQFGGTPVSFELKHGNAPGRHSARRECEVTGSDGILAVDASGYTTYLGPKREPGPSAASRPNHFGRFLDAMRSRNQSGVESDIGEGAISSDLVHFANLSARLGRPLFLDAATGTCRGDREAAGLARRQYRDPFVVPDEV